MGRRKDGEFFELIKLAFKLPWPVGFSAALAVYFCLHIISLHFASTSTAGTPAELGVAVSHQVYHTFAAIFQYVIPLGLMIGALGSLLQRLRTRSLFERVRTNPGTDVSSLSWQDFELLIGEGFRHRGYHVTERGGAVPDGGIDLILTRDNERFFVQCKQWRARSVGVSVVRELYGVMAAKGAIGGFVVTSGKFSSDALSFAEGRNIELLDEAKVEALIRDGKKSSSTVIGTAVMSGPPACPRCLSPMVERVAKRGKHAGKRLWGCQHYPKCQSFIPIE
jgi:restriction system protein